MTTTLFKTTAAAAVLALMTSAAAAHDQPGQRYGSGAPGHGPGYGGMMGPGMVGGGPAAGQSLPRDLSSDDARHLMQHRLGRMGMPNLRLGEVTDRDDDTIVTDIVTGDGALVQRMAIDRHTGQMRPAKEEEAN